MSAGEGQWSVWVLQKCLVKKQTVGTEPVLHALIAYKAFISHELSWLLSSLCEESPGFTFLSVSALFFSPFYNKISKNPKKNI